MFWVCVLLYHTLGLVFVVSFARQNDDFRPSIVPVVQPPQFFAPERKARGGLIVLFDLTAIRRRKDRPFLGTGNRGEKLHAEEGFYLWDPLKQRCPVVLLAVSVTAYLETDMD
jgi:hypothetical protein